MGGESSERGVLTALNRMCRSSAHTGVGVPRARVMIEAMNSGACVHAVDLPSGINGTSGAVMGELRAVQAVFSYYNDDPTNIRNIAATGGAMDRQ